MQYTRKELRLAQVLHANAYGIANTYNFLIAYSQRYISITHCYYILCIATPAILPRNGYTLLAVFNFQPK